jgi:hypothetical protein
MAVFGFWLILLNRQAEKPQTGSTHFPAIGGVSHVLSPATTSLQRVAPDPSLSPDFSLSMERLSEALEKFPNRDPRSVLTGVRDDNAAQGANVCSFEWNNGAPRLLFGKAQDHLPLEAAMNRCADAVNQKALHGMPATPPARPVR